MFYKYENEELIYGTIVLFPDGVTIAIENKDEHTYPVNGWHYFETEEEAKTFFNIE